jgi:hypothetical protein
MKRLVLTLIVSIAVLTVGGLVLFRESGKLPDSDLVEVRKLVPVADALRWRERAEETSSRFTDPERAQEAGYLPLEPPGLTSWQHLVNWPAIEDTTVLDPREPEALLYRVENGTWTLVAEVFLMPRRYTYANTPEIAEGGAIWHTHPTACLTGDPFVDPKLGTIDLNCTHGKNFPDNLMIHAWVVPNPCGPFATAIVENETLELITEGVSGLDENGKIPGCEPELAERVWPGVTD